VVSLAAASGGTGRGKWVAVLLDARALCNRRSGRHNEHGDRGEACKCATDHVSYS